MAPATTTSSPSRAANAPSFHADPAACPVLTTVDKSAEELAQPDYPEIKAYKLGKRRWSYNQCELRVIQAGSGGQTSVEVVEAVQFPTTTATTAAGSPPSPYVQSVGPSSPASMQASPMSCGEGNLHSIPPAQPPTPAEEASVTYQVRLGNGYRIRVIVFVVHEEPAGAVAAPGGATHFTWRAVARSECKKGCTGPVLRSIQRFGRLGRRSGAPTSGDSGGTSPVATSPTNNGGATSPNGGSNSCNSPAERDKVKEARYLYLSIDEAGTHVGARAFRLIAAAYDAAGLVPLGATVSPPIRVLANNDVPTGAAFISLHLPLRADWQGWLPGVRGTTATAGNGASADVAGRAAPFARAEAAAAGVGVGSSPLGASPLSGGARSAAAAAWATQQQQTASAAAAKSPPPRSPNKRPPASALRASAQQQAQAQQQRHRQQQQQALAAPSLPHLLLSHAVSSSMLNDPSQPNAAVGAASAPLPPPPVRASSGALADDVGDGVGGSPPKRQRKQQSAGSKEALAAATAAGAAAAAATTHFISAGAGVPAPRATTVARTFVAAKPFAEDTAAAGTATAANAAPTPSNSSGSPSAALAARLFHTGVCSPTAAAGAAPSSAAAAAGLSLPHLIASRIFAHGGGGGGTGLSNPCSPGAAAAPGSPGLPPLSPALLGSWGAQQHHHLLSAIGGGASACAGNGGSSSGGSGSPLAIDALGSAGGDTPTAASAWRTASLSALVAGWPATPRSAAIMQASAAAGTGLQSAGGSGALAGGTEATQTQAKETASAVATTTFDNAAVAP